MTAGRLSHRLKRGAWLALLAVWLQALLPAVHHPAGMALAGGLSAADQRNLCHAPGDTAPSSPADPGKAPSHAMPACALCQAVHAIGGFSPPTGIAIPTAPFVKADAFTVIKWPPVRGRRYFNRQQPRAPPASA